MRLLTSLGKAKDYELGMLMFEEEMGYHPTIFLPSQKTMTFDEKRTKILNAVSHILTNGNSRDCDKFNVLAIDGIVTFTALNSRLRGIAIFKGVDFKYHVERLVNSGDLIKVDLTEYGFKAEGYRLG